MTVYIYIYIYKWRKKFYNIKGKCMEVDIIGLVDRVFVNGLGDWGSIPG